MPLWIEKTRSMQGSISKLVIQTREIGRTRPVKLSRATLVQHSSAQLKNLGNFVEELFGKRLGPVDQENGAAESVQTFNILLPGGSLKRSSFGLFRKAARNQRCGQKAEQCDPVLRVSDSERADWWKEKKVEKQGSENRRQ